MSLSNKKYCLPDGVFISIIENNIIFLNLHTDKYCALESDETATLLPHVSVDLEKLHPSAISALSKRTHKKNDKNPNIYKSKNIINDLIDQKLLTTKSGAKKLKPIEVNIPKEDLFKYDFDIKPKIKFSHILIFICASTSAFLQIRFNRIEHIIRKIKKKQSKNSLIAANEKTARELMEVFKILRPLFFTSKNECLFDSLSLLRFMELHGVRTTWVFGVTLRPFVAHCWVQDSQFVYNDYLEHVHLFSPIMSV